MTYESIRINNKTLMLLDKIKKEHETYDDLLQKIIACYIEFVEIKDLIEADLAYENNKNIITFSSIEELDKFFKE